MFKKCVFAFCVYLFTFVALAQENSITGVLQEIEKNNSELRAYSTLIESKNISLKTGNNLPDPEFGAYYMPFGDHLGGDYTEFQITQSIEFPTIYSARNKLIEVQMEQMNLEYFEKKQEVLTSAKKHCFELISLNKKLSLELTRVAQAKKVFEHVEEQFNNELVGILDYNKAKIAWLQEQFGVQQIELDMQNILLLLKNLNGGIDISFKQNYSQINFEIPSLDTLWVEKQSVDPSLQIMKQNETIAAQQIDITKKSSFPDITAGFNRQGISGAYYSGIFGGLTIPLWNNKNKVKSAEAKYNYQQTANNIQLQHIFTEFEKQYNQYQLLLTRFHEYNKTMTGLNSETLLLQAYEIGKISFLEYYMELNFYREAIYTQLQLELQLSQLKTELLKHQL